MFMVIGNVICLGSVAKLIFVA